jgi:monoamine oxidase
MSGHVEVDVAVIGAGAAGLAAARELRAGGCSSVLVLEASERVGGRVRNGVISSNGFELPVELGPEFVHGAANNALLEALVEMGCAVQTLEWPNYYYLGKEGRLIDGPTAEALPEIAAMHSAFEAIGTLDAARTREQSLLEHFASRGVASRVIDVADAVYANDYGADMSSIGLREVIVEQRAWAHGEEYLVLAGRRSLSDAMRHVATGTRILHGFEATLVDWRARAVDGTPRVRVVDASGAAVVCRRLILTLPLACLQRGAVSFAPELPAAKREAISRVRVGNALKVAVALSTPIWPKGFWDAVCSDCTFPEVWLTPAAEALSADRPVGKPFVVVAFVAGERSERLAELPDSELVRLLLHQLDQMFGSADEPRPASGVCVGHLVCNWGGQPFAWGAYTHPTLGAGDARRAIREPLGAGGGLVHFAGEATNLCVNPCVHGAMATGVDAARAVLASLSDRRSVGERAGGLLSRVRLRESLCAGALALALALVVIRRRR